MTLAAGNEPTDVPTDGGPTDDRPAGRRRPGRPSARVVLALVVAVAVVVAGARLVLVRDGRASVEATVRAFFAARQDGDCTRVARVLSEESWSEGGGVDPEQFLERCDQVIGDYRPGLDRVEVVAETGDRAVVEIAIPPDDDPRTPQAGLVVQQAFEDGGERGAYERGVLVREDGAWKVQADEHVLRIGRSIEDTVRGYIDAYNAGDCEGLVDHLSETAWSEDGRLSRDQYLDHCADDVEARTSAAPPDDTLAAATELRMPVVIDVSVDEDDRTAATATWEGFPVEAVRLVKEGAEWKLSGDPEAVRYAELQALLLDEPLPGYRHDIAGFVGPGVDRTLDFDLYEGSDGLEQRRRTGFERGVVQRFSDGDNDIAVLLYEFESGEGAGGYADHLAERVGLRVVAARRTAGAIAADGEGTAIDCADDACARATEAVAIGVHDRMIAAVRVSDYLDEHPLAGELIGRAEGVLQAQLERLP